MRGAGIETDASGLIVPGSMFKRDLWLELRVPVVQLLRLIWEN